MDKDIFNILMETYIRETLDKIKDMEEEFANSKMELFTKVNGEMII